MLYGNGSQVRWSQHQRKKKKRPTWIRPKFINHPGHEVSPFELALDDEKEEMEERQNTYVHITNIHE